MLDIHQEHSSSLLPSYLTWADSRWVSPLLDASAETVANLSVMALGLAGEVSEVAEVISLWAHSGKRQDLNLEKELGDVFYYWACLSNELSYSLPRAYHPGELAEPPLVLDGAPPVLKTLHLVAAQGHVTEAIKKFIRDGSLNREKFRSAMLTVFILWQELCGESGYHWRDILQVNVDKVNGRWTRGTSRGSGDHR